MGGGGGRGGVSEGGREGAGGVWVGRVMMADGTGWSGVREAGDLKYFLSL